MKRDDIIEAAFDEFGESYYDNASINRIIQVSNTSKGTFYHYFPTKESLYLELLQIVLRKKVNFMNTQNSVSKTKAEATLFDTLRAQIDFAMSFAFAYPQMAKFSSLVTTEPNRHIANKTKAIVHTGTEEAYLKWIQENQNGKAIRDDLSAEFTSNLILFLLQQFNEFLKLSNIEILTENMEQIKKTLHDYIDFIENGLKGQSRV